QLSLEKNSRKLFRECGLWGDSEPVPPWQWRNGARNGSQVTTAAGKYSAISGGFHGNMKSHMFHSPSCQSYNCKNCTATFSSKSAALKAGYRACGQCRP
ncbi:MAG: nuclease, partial [Desulforhopalus sp.]|nr:nuclease [Desulforhopalus sp.]